MSVEGRELSSTRVESSGDGRSIFCTLVVAIIGCVCWFKKFRRKTTLSYLSFLRYVDEQLQHTNTEYNMYIG